MRTCENYVALLGDASDATSRTASKPSQILLLDSLVYAWCDLHSCHKGANYLSRIWADAQDAQEVAELFLPTILEAPIMRG